MAIAFDTSSQGTAGADPSGSHTCTGSDRLLIVIVGSATDTNTGVTYNGVAMTQVTATSYPGAGYQGLKMWYLNNPASGSNTIAVTSSNAGTNYTAQSFTGCDQTSSVVDSSAVNNNATGTTSLTVTTTVVASNCWLVGGSSNNQGTEVFGGTGTTVRQYTGQGGACGDSNATVSTGSQSLIFTQPGSTLFRGIIMSIAPSTAVAGATRDARALALLGVG